MDLKLRAKVVLVTGSSRGIGLATAKAFPLEDCRLRSSWSDTLSAVKENGRTVGPFV